MPVSHTSIIRSATPPSLRFDRVTSSPLLAGTLGSIQTYLNSEPGQWLAEDLLRQLLDTRAECSRLQAELRASRGKEEWSGLGSSGAAGSTRPDSFALSCARAQVDQWFRLRSSDYQAQVFESNSVQEQGALTREKLPDCLADLGLKIGDVNKMFEQLDVNKDGALSLEEFKGLVQRQTPLRAWASSLPIADLVAHALPVKAHDDFAEDLCRLDGRAIQAVVQAVSDGLQRLLLENIALLVQTRQAQSAATQTAEGGAAQKFQLDPLSCGSADDFQMGLTDRVGTMSLNTWPTMRKEHVTLYGSGDFFTASNYNITTRPSDEWLLVEGAEGKNAHEFAAFLEERGLKVGLGAEYHGRRIPNVAVLLRLESVKDAGLSREELYAIVLYTGPMFVPYNMILRRFPQEGYARFAEGRNLFSTTILVLVSALTKLAAKVKIPHGTKLFRGLGSRGLPSCFFRSDELGRRGFAEYAPLSSLHSLVTC